MNKNPAIYILTNTFNSVFYIGVTSNLVKRIWEHKNHIVAGFTQRYKVERLVYYESHETMKTAILREKQLKNWHREWKINLIKSKNPELKDLYEDIV